MERPHPPGQPKNFVAKFLFYCRNVCAWSLASGRKGSWGGPPDSFFLRSRRAAGCTSGETHLRGKDAPKAAPGGLARLTFCQDMACLRAAPPMWTADQKSGEYEGPQHLGRVTCGRGPREPWEEFLSPPNRRCAARGAYKELGAREVTRFAPSQFCELWRLHTGATSKCNLHSVHTMHTKGVLMDCMAR